MEKKRNRDKLELIMICQSNKLALIMIWQSDRLALILMWQSDELILIMMWQSNYPKRKKKDLTDLRGGVTIEMAHGLWK